MEGCLFLVGLVSYLEVEIFDGGVVASYYSWRGFNFLLGWLEIFNGGFCTILGVVSISCWGGYLKVYRTF